MDIDGEVNTPFNYICAVLPRASEAGKQYSHLRTQTENYCAACYDSV